MATKKKTISKSSLVSHLIAPQGSWYAVMDDRDYIYAAPVALWASGTSGVVGLVSLPGEGTLQMVPEDCLGYVQVLPGADPQEEAIHWYNLLEDEEEIEGYEDEDVDEDGEDDEPPRRHRH